MQNVKKKQLKILVLSTAAVFLVIGVIFIILNIVASYKPLDCKPRYKFASQDFGCEYMITLSSGAVRKVAIVERAYTWFGGVYLKTVRIDGKTKRRVYENEYVGQANNGNDYKVGVYALKSPVMYQTKEDINYMEIVTPVELMNFINTLQYKGPMVVTVLSPSATQQSVKTKRVVSVNLVTNIPISR